nr:PEPxxWA-CTERM sorting domain-containing protein [Altericroceibacterium xinjiangense]
MLPESGIVGGGPGGFFPPSGGGQVSSPVTTIPEPQTWAMMILGMGMCGAALRRRNARIRREAYV